jgi:hypothetical protein
MPPSTTQLFDISRVFICLLSSEKAAELTLSI